MKVIIAHPSIAPHVKQNVIGYDEADFLLYFFTTFFDHPDALLANKLSAIRNIKELIRRRQFNEIAIEKFKSRPLPELIRSFAARKTNAIITDLIWEWAELGFDKWVAKAIKHYKPDVIHTYEHAALASLQQAKSLNIFSVYEQPSQHHSYFTPIVEKQFELYPVLKTGSTSLLINKKAERRNRRRDQELALASIVICNSTFTKKTLVAGGVAEDKICVIPLGFPPVKKISKNDQEDNPVIFLYAGNQSIRKGSHLLYEAWRNCNFAEAEAKLILVGKMTLPEAIRTHLPGNVLIKGNIPHHELMNLYGDADVFVLPTLADGFGMVITESMANGIPVIATDACCGPDVINHNENGWIIAAGDLQALINQMKWCVNHRQALKSFGIKAQQSATKWQWSDYRKKLNTVVYDKWIQYNQKQSV